MVLLFRYADLWWIVFLASKIDNQMLFRISDVYFYDSDVACRSFRNEKRETLTGIQQHLFGNEIIKVVIERLKTFEPPEGYLLAFSGGKDSVCVKGLADEAGIKYKAEYRLVPVDPPELIKFIRRAYPEVNILRPRGNMIEAIAAAGYPTRQHRWCCEYFKHPTKWEGITITGIRWVESVNRSHRKMYEPHRQGKGIYLNPIIDWLDSDVWSYIRSRGLPYCELYDQGWKRLGCVGCPMVRDTKSLERWPKVLNIWYRGMKKWFDKKPRENWSSFDALWKAWLDRDSPLHGDIGENECLLFDSFGSEKND